MNQPQSLIDALSEITSYTFDLLGRQIAVMDPRTYLSTTVYDAVSNVTALLKPDTSWGDRTYDLARQLLNATDEVSWLAQAVSSLGQWTQAAGSWIVNAFNQLQLASGSTSGVIVPYPSTGNALAAAEGTLNAASGTQVGVVAGFQDANNFYHATLAAGSNATLTIYKVFGDVQTTLAQAAVSALADVPHNIRLSSIGGQLTAYLNNAFGVSTNNATFSGGQVGVRIDQPSGTGTATVNSFRGSRLGVTQYVRIPTGLVQTEIDPLGFLTTYSYDPVGRKIATQDAAGGIQSTVYNLDGQVIVQVDANGNATTLLYDNARRPYVTIDALGNRTTTTYYPNGLKQSVIDPLGHATTYVYDMASRLQATIDANANITTNVYDQAGRRIAVVNALGQAVTTGYDGADRPVIVTDPRGNATTMAYDQTGRLLSKTDPLDRTTFYHYDGSGNRIFQQDARGYVVTMGYDSMNRLLTEQYPSGRLYSYSYDPAGRRLAFTDTTGTTSFTYDNRNSVLAQQSPSGKTVSYSYDAANRRSTMTNPDGGLTTYTHDLQGNLTNLVNPQFKSTATVFDALNRPRRKTLGNGFITTNTYDPAGRLSNIQTYNALDTLESIFSYSYDNTSNRLGVAEGGNTSAVTTWTYDAAYQLLSENRTGGFTGFCTTYTYDPAGNRLYVDDASVGRTTYTHDEANQMQLAVSPTSTTSYSYDNNGNVTGMDVAGGAFTAYLWDETNRLAEFEPVGPLTTMVYDARGKRVQKNSGGSVTNFIYDFDRLLQETDGSGDTEWTFTSTDEGWGDLLSEYEQGGDTFYHAYDGLGSTEMLMDGTTPTPHAYRSFGQQTDPSSVETPFGFAGRQNYYNDTTLDLYLVGLRYYSADMGRFVSEDPIGLDAGDANLYRYVGNNPVNRTDPSGEDDKTRRLILSLNNAPANAPSEEEKEEQAEEQDLGGYAPSLVFSNSVLRYYGMPTVDLPGRPPRAGGPAPQALGPGELAEWNLRLNYPHLSAAYYRDLAPNLAADLWKGRLLDIGNRRPSYDELRGMTEYAKETVQREYSARRLYGLLGELGTKEAQELVEETHSQFFAWSRRIKPQMKQLRSQLAEAKQRWRSAIGPDEALKAIGEIQTIEVEISILQEIYAFHAQRYRASVTILDTTAEKNARYVAHLRREPERVPDEIARLTSTEKIRLALSRAREKLGPEFRKQFDAIFTWTNLSIMLGFAGGLALAQTVGIGEAVDATLILLLGVDLTLTFLHLCYSIASAQSAVNNAEINECATSIAHDFVTLAESGAFFLLGFGVGKGWKALRKGKGAPSAIPETASPSEPVPPPKTPVTPQPSAISETAPPSEPPVRLPETSTAPQTASPEPAATSPEPTPPAAPVSPEPRIKSQQAPIGKPAFIGNAKSAGEAFTNLLDHIATNMKGASQAEKIKAFQEGVEAIRQYVGDFTITKVFDAANIGGGAKEFAVFVGKQGPRGTPVIAFGKNGKVYTGSLEASVGKTASGDPVFNAFKANLKAE